MHQIVVSYHRKDNKYPVNTAGYKTIILSSIMCKYL